MEQGGTLFFTVGACLGIALYLVLIPIDLLHAR
jgi:hypothetical protein